jgi:hypothetical protein
VDVQVEVVDGEDAVEHLGELTNRDGDHLFIVNFDSLRCQG